jgi:tetratricopeptide (TPR) repeat protein
MGDGFVTKAIAIYKKIAKLAPEATAPLEKLAELYVQQGVMNEARSLYLQLAESHLRAARQDKAVEVLRRLLDLEPENLRVQLRLAELYSSIGQKAEAAHAYLNCAHRMFDHSQFAEALRYVEQAIKADPKNTRAPTLKSRLLAATGKLDDAVSLLETLPDAAAGGDTTQLLLGFYLQCQRTDAAVALARKAFAGSGRYSSVYELSVQLLDSGEAEKAFELLGEIRAAMIEAKEFDKLSQALATMAERLPGRLEPIEWLVDVHRQAGDAYRLPQALDQLAEAATAAGQLDRARQIFEDLVQNDPANEDLRRKLNQVRARLGLETVSEAPATVKEAASEASVAAAPAEEEVLDEETQRFVSQTMTDVDLFASYGMTQKAIDLLESAVQRVPSHTGMLEKLLDMHLGAGNERRTSELAAQLEKIFAARGDAGRVERFSELRRRFDRAARLTEEAPAAAPAAPEFSLTPAAPAAPGAPAQPAEEEAVHEVDLSAEWASMSQLTPEPAPAETPPPSPEAPAEEIELSLQEAPAAEAAPSPAEVPPAAEAVEYELELAPAPAAQEAAPAAPPAAKTTDSFLSELAAEVDELELGPAVPAGAPSVPAAAPPKPSEESVEQLKEVFDEFRSELGQMGGEEAEDLETHYNLGIAYREMGLVEEAIGEFQKVAQAVQKGRPFRYAMQCCTLLGLSFMDKGQPNVAVVWYRKALETPNLDQESVMALRYDLGVAQEMAGDPKAALESFTQVYAMNIDYRDVADRIATLQKQT